MAVSELASLLSSLNPTSSQIGGLFTGLGRISPPVLKVLIKSLDEEFITKLATWSKTFVDHMNQIKTQTETEEDVGTPDFSDDFIETMRHTQYIGHKISWNDLNIAQSHMVRAVKAENWQKAIWVGISLGRLAGA